MRCHDPARIRAVLRSRQAGFKGLDHQVDTYFRVPSGRLKLREGNIENALIYYKRADQKGFKCCDSILYKCPDGSALKKVLTNSLGVLAVLIPINRSKAEIGAAQTTMMKKKRKVWAVVDKKREIYFIRNVKFHIDRVKRLGNFVEIEVFGRGKKAKLRKQCEFYLKLLGIKKRDLIADSYSDQMLRR